MVLCHGKVKLLPCDCFDPLVVRQDESKKGNNSSGIAHFPEFMNFKLFGKTILVVNIGLFLGHPLSQ